MSTSPLLIRKAAVLGAGVMGAQIAAHFANAGIPALLFDLPAKDGDPNGLVTKAIAGLAKLEPAPLGAKDRAAMIEACNYGSDLARLAECDLGRHCRSCSEAADDPARLGGEVTTLLGGIGTVGEAVALLDGKAPTADQVEVADLLRTASRALDEALGRVP